MQLNNFASDKARIVSAEKIIRSGEKVSSEASVLGKKISDAEVFENAKISGKLRYSKLFSDAPEISADYSVYHNKIEEDIFINAPTDIRSFTMNIQSGGLLVCLNDDGSVDFLDENGDMQYHIGIPYMEDANGDVLNDIDVSVKQNGNACTVTYTPDESWLTSSDREYPILLDPSVTTKEYNSNIVDTYVYEGNTANHSSEQKLFFGVKSGKIHRVYLKINNLPSIDAGSPILSAKMTLSFWAGTSTGKTAEVYKAAGAWNPSEITYAGQPGYISSSRLISLPFSASNKTMTFDLTDDIAKLYDDYYADENFGYVIKYSDETLNNPDYNTFYATDATLSDKRPVMTVVYGYSLPSHLVEGGIYSLENAGSGSLATVHNGTDANYVNIYQYNTEISARTASQKFKLEKVSATGGYLFRAMCSANGTNRVIDIQRNGDYPYPENGGNAYLYTATASKTQEWLIIGVTYSSFKIVLRNDMTLALTAYPSTANGTSGGKTSTSPGNIFLATYDATNVYQEWRFIDEGGSCVLADYENYYLNGTYYINNTETGKYLHKNGSSSIPNAVSGLISNLGDSIRWKITHIGNGEYLIQPVDDLTKYLKVVSKNGGGVIYGTLSSNGEIPDEYRWKFVQQRFKNVSSSTYLYVYVIDTTSYGISDTTNTSKAIKWRVVSVDDYGNTSQNSVRELRGYALKNTVFYYGTDTKIQLSKAPSNALWSSSSDFVYEYYSGDSNSFYINQSNQMVSAKKFGNAKIKVTHKVTGIVKYLDISVRHKNDYTNLLIENYNFDDEGAMLIEKMYNSLKSLYPNDSEIVISWRFSRLIGGIIYEYDKNDPLSAIKWKDAAGDPFDIYMTIEDGTQVQATGKVYFMSYLGYSSAEYDNLESKLKLQHETCKAASVCDYAHMQISLSARLAYYLGKDGVLSNIYGSDLKISYLAGWLGDATISGKDEDGNMSLDFDNDDYLADLDAENLYRWIINNPAAKYYDISLSYYRSLSTTNRAVQFKQYIPISTVKQMIYNEMFSSELSDDVKLEWLRIEYTPTYNFIMSLENNCPELVQWS